MMTEAVEDLTATLNEAASAAGVVGGMVDSITQAINQVRGSGEGDDQEENMVSCSLAPSSSKGEVCWHGKDL